MSIQFGGFSDYDTDSDIESVKGVDLKFETGETITVLRAGGANKKYSRTLQKLSRPVKRRIDNGSITMEESEALMIKVFAQSVVIDWAGVVDIDGNEVPCTPLNVEALFTQKRDLFREVQNFASSIESFRKQELEEAAEELGN